MRSAATWPVLAVGCLCGAVGQAILFDRVRVSAWLMRFAPAPLTQWSTEFLPPAIPFAIVLVLTGAALVVAALSGDCPRTPPDRASSAVVPTVMPTWPLVLCLALALVVAIGCGVQPSNGWVLIWVASIVLPIPFLFARRESTAPVVRDGCEILTVLGVSAAAFAYVAHDLADWRWAGTPDEAPFFDVARSIALGHSNRFLFSETGAFDLHPVLASAYQAVFLKLFGVDVVGWRLSSVVAFTVSLPLFYGLARELFDRRVASFALALFATTPLAVTFAHLGYDNVHVYPITAAALAAATRSARGRRGWSYVAGVAAGLGFYTYYPARLALPLVLLLELTQGGRWRERRAHVALLMAGFAVTVAPLLASVDQTLAHMAHFTRLGGDAGGGGFASLMQHWSLALLYPLWFVQPHHFQSQPVVDPISAWLAAVGLVWCLRVCRRCSSERFLLIAFLLSALLVGASSQHYRPPLTRLLFLAPFLALLAARGLERWIVSAGGDAGRAIGATWFGALVIAASVAWSVATLRYNLDYRYHGYDSGITSEIVRLIQPMSRSQKLLVIQPAGTPAQAVDLWLALYGWGEQAHYSRDGLSSSVQNELDRLEPPFTIITSVDQADRGELEARVRRRFALFAWKESAPGERWNLYFGSVAAGETFRRNPDSQSLSSNSGMRS